jgi:ABC-2 type transport system permease protein
MNWWKFVIASEIRKILAFRFDFWITFIAQSIIQIIISISLWSSIFEADKNKILNGFSFDDMILYYLIVPIGTKMLTGENIGFLSREIYDGTFNRYLLYPISFFQYKILTYLTYSFFYGLQLLFVFFVYHQFYDSLTFEVSTNLFLGLIFFILASVTYANIAMMVELISLWVDNIWSLMVMTRFLCFFLGGAYVPINFFPTFLQNVLEFTPFPYLINLPIKIIMGMANQQDMFFGFVSLTTWSIFFHLTARYIWDKGQYRYSGVGI